MSKTAWIFSGGAARTVFVAGVLSAVCEMNAPRPDIIIACSGSAATSLCYVTDQHKFLYNVWCRSLSTKKFVNFLRFWKIVDIDYLIDIVLKKDNPLDMEKVINSPIDIFFPVTESISGKLDYLTNRMNLDIWEILRAAKMSPIFTNLFSVKGNYVNGKYYSDSLASSRFQLHVRKAIDEGASKIIVFDSYYGGDSNSKNTFSKLYTKLRNRTYRQNQLNYIKKIEMFRPPKNIKYYRLGPKSTLEMSRFEIDNDNAKKVFKKGYNESINNNEFINFMKDN